MPTRLPAGAIVAGWLLILLFVGLGWLIASYPGKPTQGAIANECKSIAKSEGEANAKHSNTENTTSAVDQPEPEILNTERENPGQQHNNERRLTEYTCQLAIYTAQLATFTKWLVGATFVVGAIGLWQGRVLGRHVSAVEADSEKRLRAYLQAIVDPNAQIFINNSQLMTCPVTTQNAGQTPAHNVEVNANIAPAVYPLMGDLPTIQRLENPSRTVIHPGQKSTAQLVADRLLTQVEVERLQRDSSFRLYLYGAISYEDVFGRKRITEFRLVTPDPRELRGGSSRFGYCYDGNTAT